MRRGRLAMGRALLVVLALGCSRGASPSDGGDVDTDTTMESARTVPGASAPMPDADGIGDAGVVGANMADVLDAGVGRAPSAADEANPVDPVADSGIAEAGAECNASGIWIARMLTVIRALGLEQCGNHYDYLELRQTGSEIEVIDHLSCGFEDRGSVMRRPTEAAARAMLGSNSQIGRKGTMVKDADGLCQLTMEPHWAVWGVDEESYVPQPRNSPQPLREVSRANPLPREGDGVLDPDGDGRPGMSIEIRGALSVDAQIILRSVHRWATNDRYPITPAAAWTDDLEVQGDTRRGWCSSASDRARRARRGRRPRAARTRARGRNRSCPPGSRRTPPGRGPRCPSPWLRPGTSGSCASVGADRVVVAAWRARRTGAGDRLRVPPHRWTRPRARSPGPRARRTGPFARTACGLHTTATTAAETATELAEAAAVSTSAVGRRRRDRWKGTCVGPSSALRWCSLSCWSWSRAA